MALRREFTEARIRDTWSRVKSHADFSRYGGRYRAWLDEGYSPFEHPVGGERSCDKVAYAVCFQRSGNAITGTVEGTDISVIVEPN